MTERLAGPRGRSRARDLVLLSATALVGLTHAAEAARFGVVVNPVTDPLLAGLAIPETAPTTGMWSGLRPWPMNAIHLSLLPSGRVVSFGTAGGNPGVQDGRTFDTWDPYRGLAQDSHLTIAGVRGVNSFCSAQSFLADGSLLVAGGIFDDGNDRGSVVMNARGTGIAAIPARLANDRYYSTMLTLPNGQQVIVGGSYPYLGGWADTEGAINQGFMTGMTPEIYDGARWRSLLGAKSRDAFGPDFNRFWYPRAWVAPDGRVFGISSEKMWYLNTAGAGSVTTLPFKGGQREVGNAQDAPNVGPASTAVMYETGKILQVGGNAYSNGEGFLASSRATVIDINGGTPVLTEAAPMGVGRAWANATVLPTGHVAVTGGSRYNDRGGDDVVLQSEIWNPATGRWSVGASGAVYRGYHASTILLQNGALLVAGGGAPGPVTNENAEFFYPPYLFATVNGRAALAPRPQIQSLSTLQLQHGQRMQFELTSPNGLSQVVLIALSQTTHSFNVGQRRYVAVFTQPDAQTVTVQAPPNANIAPPGYYQLVAIDRNGVPSPGVIVAVGAVSAPVQAAAPTVPVATAGAGGGTGGAGGTGGTGGTGTPGTAGGGVPAPNNGTQIGIAAARVSVGADGTLVTVNADSGTLWRYMADNQWVQIPGTAKDVAVVNANSIYTIGQNDNIYRYDGKNSVPVGYAGKTISAASDGTIVTVNLLGEVWRKRTDDNQNAWVQIPGKAKSVAVMNRNSLWAIGLDNNVYRIDAAGQWVRVGVSASQIAASPDGSVMVVNSDAGTLWRKSGDNTVEAWAPLNAPMKPTAIAIPNGQRTIAVGPDRNIYRW